MSTQQAPQLGAGALDANWRGYRFAAWAGQAVLAAALVVVLMQGRFTGALTLAGFLVAALVFVTREDRLPPVFDFLFVVAALVNAAGWVWNLFERPGPYDEIAHAYTTFAITLALGLLAYGSLFGSFRAHRWLFMLVIASFGIAVGALWEVAEWSADKLLPADVVSGLDDTIVDLIVDSLGALVAGAVAVWALGKTRAQP